MSALRVVLAVRQRFRREALRTVLEEFSEFELVALSPDEPELMAAIERDPTIVVIDVAGSPSAAVAGLALVSGIARLRSTVGVIVVGDKPDAELAEALLDRGVARRGYLLCDALLSGEQVATAIRRVAAGKSAIDARVVVELIERRTLGEPLRVADLTERESQVLVKIAGGTSNAVIAKTLGITENAVDRHIRSIYPKLDPRGDEAVSPRVAASLLHLRAMLARERAERLKEEAQAVRAQARLQLRRSQRDPP